MNTMVRGLAVTALTAGLVGGVAGMAQAQQMHRPVHAAVQPATRDMGLSQNTVRPAQSWSCSPGTYPYLNTDGVRIRQTPGGRILGLAYSNQSIAFHFPAYGGTWYITDASTTITGYIADQFVDCTLTPTQPAG